MPSRPPGSRRAFLGGLGSALALGAAGLLRPPPAAAALPERALELHHLCTGETVRAVYFADGGYETDGLRRLSRLLRDWRTGEVLDVDPAVLDIVHRLQRRLEVAGPIEVLCGYRAPATNAMLHRLHHEVARRSLHMRGMAIDLRVPGRDPARVRDAALGLGAGGVGFYPAARFVHLDCGPVRHWVQDGPVAAGGEGGAPPAPRAARRAGPAPAGRAAAAGRTGPSRAG